MPSSLGGPGWGQEWALRPALRAWLGRAPALCGRQGHRPLSAPDRQPPEPEFFLEGVQLVWSGLGPMLLWEKGSNSGPDGNCKLEKGAQNALMWHCGKVCVAEPLGAKVQPREGRSQRVGGPWRVLTDPCIFVTHSPPLVRRLQE